ncbi:MAG: RdgB/HAM1 family non-canonical purine NTP pyrophosphatase [Clostridiaceae bacterium]|nr:RdgB/HAM1 family non-canonical purine NTP pyrophosphatase [Clostridiaceae bacterium]
MRLIIATDNAGKLSEFCQILPDPPWQAVSMRQAGFTGQITEDGADYLENALIKARSVHRVTGGLVLADDSGLSIDVLDGAPGLHSARFAGETAGYPEKIARLHQWLQPYPAPSWTAHFICALAAVFPDGSAETVLRQVDGRIAPEPHGEGGFGYDPIFFLPERGLTMAELPEDEKNRISHRGMALRALAQLLLDRL